MDVGGGVNSPGGSFSPCCGFSSLEHPEGAKRIPRKPLNTAGRKRGWGQEAGLVRYLSNLAVPTYHLGVSFTPASCLGRFVVVPEVLRF